MTVTVMSLVALPGGGRIEGPKSDQASSGGNSLLSLRLPVEAR